MAQDFTGASQISAQKRGAPGPTQTATAPSGGPDPRREAAPPRPVSPGTGDGGGAPPSGSPIDPVERMKAIQQMLRDAGFDPGPIDGQQGPRTTAAIRQFQRAHGLVVDGIVGPQTMAVLQSAPGFAPEGPSSSPGGGSPGGGSPAPSGGLNVVPSRPTGADATAATPKAPAKSYLAVSPSGHYRLNPDGTVTQDIAEVNPQLDAEIRKNYGYESWMLDIPELRTIIYHAVAEGRDDAWVQGQLVQTQWYKTHSDTQRQWIEMSANNPAQAHQKLQQTIDNITAEAASLGVNIQPDRLGGMAQQILENGLDPTQVRQLLIHEGTFNMAHPTGTAAEALVRFRQTANDWMLNIPDSTLQDFMRQSMSQGRVDSSAFDLYAQQQAYQMFPWLKQLTGGDTSMTARQAVEPYRQTIAKTLEIDPNTVNFTDAKWQRLLLQTDPKTGVATPAPVYAVDQTLRTDPTYGWQFTDQANDQAAALAHKVLQDFGDTPG